MLTPEYLDALPDEAAALWRAVEDDILRDAARRIGKAGEFTAAADHQAWRLEQTQALRGDVVRTLARYSGRSDAVMRRLLQQAGRDALAADDAVYRAAGLAPSDSNASEALLNLLNAGYRQTRGTWKNLTATTARTVTRQFEAALDRAWLQVSSGAFDYQAAIKRAVDGLARDMKYITYPGGRRDTLEVAMRRAVLTGVNQTASKLQLARAEEMGCEFAEVSAHAGARPSHAEWQGKVYHIGGAVTVDGVRYEGFEAATHYGAGDGLCGWNCRHNFHPFFPGLSKRSYSDEELAKLEDGEEYQRRQQQRELERKVRAAKRQYLAESEAGLDAAGAKAQWQRAQREAKMFEAFQNVELLQAQLRKSKNTGIYAKLQERMSLQHVRQISDDMGLNWQNVKIQIIRDIDLLDSNNWMGYTFPNGNRVQLYPAAFTNREQLVKTLGHEYIHLQQARELGEVKTMTELNRREVEAYGSEEKWWREYLRKTGFGK